MSSQLDELFVSGNEVDQELVAVILSPFIKIDKDSCTIVPDDQWLRLSNELKIILFLVARKAMKLRGLPIDDEGVSPAEIEKETGVKGGSIRPRLKELFEHRIITKTNERKYLLPSYSLAKVKNMVDELTKEG